jgi:hypothetical protein
MKTILLVLGLLSFNSLQGFSNNDVPAIETTKAANIQDGWYKATVSYYNSSTYQRSNYTLDVKVQYNRVVAIDFGNGGSVHSGYNNSGYTYSGGILSFQRDYSSGQITSATARVSIIEGSATRTFDISL